MRCLNSYGTPIASPTRWPNTAPRTRSAVNEVGTADLVGEARSQNPRHEGRCNLPVAPIRVPVADAEFSDGPGGISHLECHRDAFGARHPTEGRKLHSTAVRTGVRGLRHQSHCTVT